ncbi:MAG: hypothetical protein FD174_2227 [Geobacteraceae bacterium]|nr:MAG: hypothetical protein FD174_2227 [Geobacteraceae bacterium]
MRVSNFKKGMIARGLALTLCLAMAVPLPAMAAPGDTRTTPTVPAELPVEIETELGPGSLKQAPLWKETVQLLENPYAYIINPVTGRWTANIVRRPGFGVTMPPLNIHPLGLNFLTDQPLRLRTSDGEISWDQPGPLFDPDQTVASLDTDGNGTPNLLRTRIGALVASEDAILDALDLARLENLTGVIPLCDTCGYLIVHNPNQDSRIPPNGTVVAVPAFVNGQLHELNGTSTTSTTPITVPLETPINEIDFLRPSTDVAGVTAPLRPYIGRLGAEALGKALFWDMQVGSDGVQSCGTCHFNAGADNRTKNQLNPNHLGGDLSLQLFGNRAVPPVNPQNPNQDVLASDFPFHKLLNPDIPGEPLLNPGNVVSDANDVMSSMGVRFRQFVDIRTPGGASFGLPTQGVRPLLSDIGTAVADPIPVFQGLRRVEPRNTPTMHAAAFNFDNFWDGRARFHFNGGSVFGASDPFSHIFMTVGNTIEGATNGHIRPDLIAAGDPKAAQPVRIKFSSLASQAVGPPLSDFEMSFAGRNWPKIGKKLLQNGVTPLANQLVATTDSRLGPFSNQGGSVCGALGRATAANKPGLCVSYNELVEVAFKREFWNTAGSHLNGAPSAADPFDGYVLTVAGGPAVAGNTNQFRQREANFSLFFGLAVQMYEQLLIPDDTPFDRFMDANPLAANGVAQPGEQGTLPPSTIRQLVTGSPSGNLTMPPGFGPDELFGFDIFAGANLTAVLPPGSARNPAGVGSNPFLRTGRCMLCHIGPEQTDHSVNISHGLLKGGAEYELPIPPTSPEPAGPFSVVAGLILAEELAETAQDVIEVEPRDMGMVDDPATPWDERKIAVPSAFAFGDQGIYNIGLRPVTDDLGRGGNDPFGWPLQMGSLALMNIAGNNGAPCVQGATCFQPGDAPAGNPFVGPGLANGPGVPMANFDPALGQAGGLFEETGEGLPFPGAPSHTLQSINPGFDKTPVTTLLPAYLAPWVSDLPAGELHPQIDELGFVPNTITAPVGGPAIEFGELLFGADIHCARWSGFLTPPVLPARWGAVDPVTGAFRDDLCPNLQSSVPGNLEDTLHGTWPFPNRVGRMGAFKAPQLRNIELTGPYFHTGSVLTLRQVVDFYMRGGDFPITNKEFRDQHILDIEEQVFGFGATTVAADPNYAQFAGGLPDTVTRYDAMPDTGAAPAVTGGDATPEYASQEDAKVALVKFLIALTDERVKFEKAPFDRPELFVPLDGTAPDNTAGRPGLLLESLAPVPRFKRIAAVGATGRPPLNPLDPTNTGPVPNFLGISSTPVPGPSNDHFDRE